MLTLHLPARRLRRAASLGLLATVACTSLAVPAAPAAAGVAPTPTGSTAMSWAATYMSDEHDYTTAEAEALAARTDVVVGIPKAFTRHVAAMRAVNPDLTLLSYTNGMFLGKEVAAGVPESEFAHDLQGRRITSTAFGSYLMEPTSAGWRSRSIATCRQRMAASGYDGCLVDMFGTGIFSRTYLSALPRVPGTATTYTPAQWGDRTLAFAAQWRTDLPDAVLVANAVGRAARYFRAEAPSRPMALAWPGAQAEDFVRGATEPVDAFPTEAAWVQTVEMIADLEARGGTGFYSAKLWVPASAAQVAQWQAYSMATVLMGGNGRSAHTFTSQRTKAGATGATAPYALPRDLGTPLGAMTKVGSAYRRDFTGGLVLVNPTTTPVSVALPATHRALDGGTRSGSVVLPANGAEVLVRTAAGPAGDTTPPVGSFDDTGDASRTADGPGAALQGSAQDDVGVARVRLVVRDRATGTWLRQDGSWGERQRLEVSVDAPGSARTSWSTRLALRPGRYAVTLVVVDGAGNENALPRPTTQVLVV